MPVPGDHARVGFGAFIKMLREREGRTQEEFAERLGVHPQTVSRWENDHIVPHWDSFEKMVSWHGCKMQDCLSLPGENSAQLDRLGNLLIDTVRRKLESPTPPPPPPPRAHTKNA